MRKEKCNKDDEKGRRNTSKERERERERERENFQHYFVKCYKCDIFRKGEREEGGRLSKLVHDKVFKN